MIDCRVCNQLVRGPGPWCDLYLDGQDGVCLAVFLEFVCNGDARIVGNLMRTDDEAGMLEFKMAIFEEADS